MHDENPDAPGVIEWQRLDPRSVRVGRLAGTIWVATAGVISLVALAIVWLVGDEKFPAGLALAAIVVALALFSWLVWFLPSRRFLFTRYRLDHLGLLIHRGRMFHSELGVLRARIQHSDVTQGPLQRAYGLATLSIATAGSDEGEIGLSGIRIEEARRLRTELTGLVSDDVV